MKCNECGGKGKTDCTDCDGEGTVDLDCEKCVGEGTIRESGLTFVAPNATVKEE